MNTERTEKFVNAIACDLEEGGFRQVSGTTLRRTLATAVSAALPLLADTGIPASQPAELAEQQGDREQFEARFRHYNLATKQDSMGCTVYVDKWVQGAWVGWQAALAATGKQKVGEVQGDALALIQRYSPNPENTEYGWMQGMREDSASGDWLHIEDVRALAARQPGAQLSVFSGGFVVGNGSGEKYMAWGQVGPEWVADRSAALWLVRRADAEALAAENEDAWLILPVERCALPPNGWACTLASGHEGPCPTIAAPPAQGIDLGPGVRAIADERQRQVDAEGYSAENDADYKAGELANAALAYVQVAAMDLAVGGRSHVATRSPPACWPWHRLWWKPKDARRDLVRAGALIAAQLDLIDQRDAAPGPRISQGTHDPSGVGNG